jgi:Protein kinase domain
MTKQNERLRRALHLAVRHSYAEIALLSARACDLSIARNKQPDAVLWSWLTVSGSWTGTIALMQPLDLAVQVVKQARDGIVEPVPTEVVMDIQGQITKQIATKVMDQLFAGGTKPTISTVRVGNGAPDVRRGNWQGYTWSIDNWWAAVFVYEGNLTTISTPAVAIDMELLPGTERITNAVPLTKVMRSKDDEGEVDWPVLIPSTKIPAAVRQLDQSGKPSLALDAKKVELPSLPITNSLPEPSQLNQPKPTSPMPSVNQSTTSRRQVVRTIHGLVTPETAQNLAQQKTLVPASEEVEDDQEIDRTQPWYKAKPEKTADFSYPNELGHYRIQGILGEGGMGIVLKAEHLTLDRRVAIKLMKPSLAGNKIFAERFMREARISASLEHPNLVNVYDAALENGYLYMALRYMDHGDLTGQLKREGPLSEPRAIHMFTALLSALHYINIKRLVHLDIKPGNVLLDSDYTPRLGDLGLARQRSSANEPEAERMGTPAYMSPEQLMGSGELDIRSDIYSMGLTLYVALTCKQPLQGEDLESTIANVLHTEPPDPRTFVPNLSDAMTQVIKKATRKRPQDRFQTPREFQDALSSVELESLHELSASGVSWFGKIFGGRK